MRPLLVALAIALLAVSYAAALVTPDRAVPMTIVLVPIVITALLGGWRDVLITTVFALGVAALIATDDRVWRTPDVVWRLVLIVAVSAVAGALASGRQRQEHEIRSIAARLRSVVDGVGVGLAVLRTDRTIELASAELASMLGCDPDALRGRSFDSMVAAEPVGAAAGDGAKLEIGSQLRGVARRDDGGAVPVRCTMTPFSEQGRDIGSLVVVTDVSDELRAREQEERERVAAEHRQRLELVGQLAGGLAHDFNNLLAAAQMAVELAKSSVDDPETSANLDVASRSIQHAGGVTRQLLTLSRRDQTTPEPLALGELLTHDAPLLRTSLGSKIELLIEVADDAPTVLLDVTQLEQVLLNLTGNARDAMPEGGTLTIRVAPANGGTATQIEVSDTGTGMAPETAARAFEPYFTTKPRQTGTGLGLAMVEQIVTRAGGSVGVTTEHGAGTTFTILLPAADHEAAHPEPARPDRAHRRLERGHGTILVVDDQVDVAQLTGILLRRAGYTVHVATDPQEALEWAASPPRLDLVLSDIVMPGIDGIELADRLRAVHPETPVLFMSGFPADHFETASARPIDLITKPFDTDALLDAVARHIHAPTTRRD